MDKKPTISIVAAMDENRGIGYKGKIPWHIKEDLLRFKHLTVGKTVIFGRKTYESLLGYYQRSGRPMPTRNTIVVSRSFGSIALSSIAQDLYYASSVEEAIKLAKKIEPVEVFISGGGEIFNKGIKYAEKLYLTIVKGKFQADTFFPDYSKFEKVVFEKNHTLGDIKFKFVELSK